MRPVGDEPCFLVLVPFTQIFTIRSLTPLDKCSQLLLLQCYSTCYKQHLNPQLTANQSCSGKAHSSVNNVTPRAQCPCTTASAMPWLSAAHPHCAEGPASSPTLTESIEELQCCLTEEPGSFLAAWYCPTSYMVPLVELIPRCSQDRTSLPSEVSQSSWALSFRRHSIYCMRLREKLPRTEL